MTGLSDGESATFSSTLVSGPLKDEEAEIEVTVSKVQKAELPEADDAFAQEASEFDTVEELRANIKERLTRMARLEQASQARDAVLETLIGQVDIAVPEHLLNSEIDARRKQITEQLLHHAQIKLAFCPRLVRGAQSELYRVTYVGKESTDAVALTNPKDGELSEADGAELAQFYESRYDAYTYLAVNGVKTRSRRRTDY